MNDALPVWSEYLILFVSVVAAFGFGTAYFRERHDKRKLETKYTEHESYYMSSADRSALATFCADHLDDVNHPNRADVVRILAAWGATR